METKHIIDTTSTLRGALHEDTKEWKVYQDHAPFVAEAARERNAVQKSNASGHKKFATIPDIVAIEIHHKYGIDIHDPMIMHDVDTMKRFKYIVMTEYPYLVVNKA